MKLSTDVELNHCVIDADGVSPPKELFIQPDQHGLTIEFPNGEFITIDLSKSVFTIYHSDSADDDGSAIYKIGS